MSETISNKDQRESFKDEAVEIREQGNLDESLEFFEKVEKWDKENSNFRGQMDVLGHMRITYSRMGDKEKDVNKKKEFKTKALVSVKKAIAIGKREILPEGPLAIQSVHLASASLDLAKFEEEDKRKGILEEALKELSKAMEGFPGSVAHKAWPSNLKAQLEYKLGNVADAIETLHYGEKCLFEGYEDEIKNDDQAELKLNVWLSGLHLTFATICVEEGRPILAKHYATSVLNIDDSKKMLGERKKEAQKILDSLK